MLAFCETVFVSPENIQKRSGRESGGLGKPLGGPGGPRPSLKGLSKPKVSVLWL